MSVNKPIIYSDLDGTLLDHYTYKATPALPTLLKVKSAHIPVILNTSKTFAELEVIRDELNLHTPFIIENGAAVYIPISTFKSQPKDTVVHGKYWVKSFCPPRDYWLTLLHDEISEFHQHYKSFKHLSVEELASITGLNIEAAKRAKQRQYGEPVQWLGDEETKAAFIKKLKNLGANIVHGGRFIHVGGYCDKGQALLWLTKLYQECFPSHPFYTIALGDGENDITMLECADIAVQIRSPVHDFPSLEEKNQVIKTDLYGPAGWAEAIEKILLKNLTSTPTQG
jgi:mannosyl-3-phosphoglycerate phosphatase